MDQDVARRLLVEGATLLVLGVPEGTRFGIDLKSWETGERFKGVKMIPPGLHFVYHSAVSSYGDAAPRVGFVHNFKRGEFVVKKWDTEAEDIDHTKTVTPEEEKRLRTNLLELDRFLGPYPYEIWEKWKTLSNKLTETLVKKLMPESGVFRSALELVAPAPLTQSDQSEEAGEAGTTNQTTAAPPGSSARRRSRPRTLEEREEALLPELRPTPGTALRLSSFPEQHYPPGATPAEVTVHSMDSSYALEKFLEQHESEMDLVGELQFSFLCFLVGQSLDAFEHWKRLVELICGCERALTKHHALFAELLWALEPQIWEVQEDFLADIVSNDNAIYRSLRTLFRAILSADNNVEPRFKSSAARFRDRLTEKLSWDFENLEEEDDDDAPVVVEL